ncbi:MAG: SH3 domain-containing protein [Hungatella sp.]|nr:SH3 domain-containing protein [Hungatella sp.]
MLKKKLIPYLVVVGLIVLIVAGALGVWVLQRYIPTKEQADIGQLLGVEGEKTAIYMNEELQKEQGITRDNQTYLPIKWVNEQLNEKFYWDEIEKLLVYTLPDSIVYADRRTMGSEGKPLILVENDGVYLAAGLVGNYTDIRTEVYNTGEYKRIYVNPSGNSWQLGDTRKKTAVRVLGGIKSPVITTLEKGGKFRILEQMTEWSKVRTEDGFIGYIPNKVIDETWTEKDINLFVEPLYNSISLDEKICLAWHQVTSDEANGTLESLIANTKGVNVIAPTWFQLTDNEGNYHSMADQEYVDLVHDRGMQIWAVLDNFNRGENVKSEVLFARTSIRKELIASLINEVKAYGIDGINLDIEGIKPEAGPHYVQFIRELSVACRNEGIILSVDNYVPTAYTSFYNRAEQGRIVDYVIIMAYDEHYAGGEAGSVSSLSYVDQGIQDTICEVPKEKVVCAIPFYTRVWTENGEKTTSSALGITSAKEWIEENQVNLYWQEELGQYYGELNTDEGVKLIWLEEETSLGLKMELIRKADLAGVACWKLGFEPENIWDVVKVNE